MTIMNAELINKLAELVGNQFSPQISDILEKYDITRKVVPTTNTNNDLLNSFLSAKRVEGKPLKTLKYYKNTISKLLTTIKKPLKQITTDDLRNYLSDFQNKKGSSNVTIDNIRRIFSSFFHGLKTKIL